MNDVNDSGDGRKDTTDNTTDDSGPGVVYTNKARCRDCWRCVRVCPVKAIRVHNGQAAVVPDRCISCGSCIRECPQGAKAYSRDIETVRMLIRKRKAVAVSLAPSFAGVFSQDVASRLPTALRRLGFARICETAVGARYSALACRLHVDDHANQFVIGSACPAVVRYVERYQPDLTGCLMPVPSPMAVHAKMLRDQLPEDGAVVFIGPCVAKKAEALRSDVAALVDAVLTFEELLEWLELEEIRVEELPPGEFDDLPGADARLYPLAGGLLRTAGMPTDMLSERHIALSGFDNLKEALENHADKTVLEPLFCRDGCINGPAAATDRNIAARRADLLAYCETSKVCSDDAVIEVSTAAFFPVLDAPVSIDEADILAVLSATGHSEQSNQLNCSACGYPSCRDRAVAVVLGLAERDMCIPYMRRLAEQRSDRILETSPNGIVILDSQLNILSMNPAFRRMFHCFNSASGKRISYLMDPAPFEKLISGECEVTETTVKHQRFDIVCHQICYPLRDENQFVGIFVNITGQWLSEEKLGDLKRQTIERVQDLLEHHLAAAEQLAGFLGESTARGELLVDTIRKLVDDHDDEPGKGPRWDISTSK